MKSPPADSDALRDLRRVLELRAKLNDALRRFFRERGFLEVDTPVVLAANAPLAINTATNRKTITRFMARSYDAATGLASPKRQADARTRKTH